MAIKPEKRPSFVSKWLEASRASSDLESLTDETERTSLSSFSTSTSTWVDEELVPPPPTPLRETSSHFAAWDMTSADNLSADEIQAVMIALTANDQSPRDIPDSDSEDEDGLSFIAPPPTPLRNVSIQQLPSVGGPEFLVTLASNGGVPATPALTEEDIQWLTGEVTKPEATYRRYSIQPLSSKPQTLKARQASVQALPSRQNQGESSYWVTLPSSGAVWKVKKNPDPTPRTVSLQRRRLSTSQRRPHLTFFRPTSRMNGKDLSFVVGRALR